MLYLIIFTMVLFPLMVDNFLLAVLKSHEHIIIRVEHDKEIKDKLSLPILKSYLRLSSHSLDNIFFCVGDSEEEISLMHAAILYGGEDCLLQFVYNKGLSLDTQDKYGRTAVMNLFLKGFYKEVCVLLRYGASIKIKDRQGKSLYDHFKDKFPALKGVDLTTFDNDEIIEIIKCIIINVDVNGTKDVYTKIA